MEISQILTEIYPLPPESITKMCEYINEVSYPKGHIILRAGKIEKKTFFIKKGVVRAFATPGENDITFWFGEEGETVLSMQSYVENNKGYEHVELLENCDFYEVHIRDLQELFKTDIHISNWGRKLAEKELVKIEKRLISRELQSAKQRYDELICTRPSLLQRVPLKFIASYLGITQVSLSRIRKEK
ncbi:Crp/Fnr family transcriptional regulator [Pedobacter caeni]|uniref:cAMP-binding domain of CRP or a regulatory subunit of cAMP-dependent protein kinases n=1 Tax=Pedobacter caeni TaxID=288992 RepID=A0A1M4ZAA6_9SPHI|nr:Crp/Fnr family transcriptional regulator [Pedobacter caeni]SHF14737.1 cAMP-binding domain of CRP or a regulatory subunit of cAMP-dependent protein kinases [Pedobacter caeni]